MRRRALIPFAVLAAAAATTVALVGAGPAQSGVEPNLLDRNLGVVVAQPRIVNLFWDNAWDTRHAAFTVKTLNVFTIRVGSTTYARGLTQYGIGRPGFIGSFQGARACGPTRAPNVVTTAQVIAWTHCMVASPFTGVPKPVVRLPVSNTLYVVYLPRNTTIRDGLSVPRFQVLGRSFGPFAVDHTACEDYGAYHAFSASTTPYAFAIVPTRCALLRATEDVPATDLVTLAASHELVEAMTNPLIGAGWINRSLPVQRILIEGEASDICDFRGALPRRIFGQLFSAYWSNARGTCVTTG
jgi:hypothetical protein